MRLGWLAGLVLIDRRACTYLPIQNTKWDSFWLQVKITSTNPNYIAHCTGSATRKPAIKKFRIHDIGPRSQKGRGGNEAQMGTGREGAFPSTKQRSFGKQSAVQLCSAAALQMSKAAASISVAAKDDLLT